MITSLQKLEFSCYRNKNNDAFFTEDCNIYCNLLNANTQSPGVKLLQGKMIFEYRLHFHGSI